MKGYRFSRYIKNGTSLKSFEDFIMKRKVGYTFSTNWCEVGYTFSEKWYKERVCLKHKGSYRPEFG